MTTELVINPEFRKLIAPLKPEEFQQLETNILRDGCKDPLVVWSAGGKNTLVDGHNRHTICTKHGLKFATTLVELESDEHAELWIEEHQAGRRNLNDDQRAMIWESIAERRSALRRKEQLARANEAKYRRTSVEDKTTSTEKEARTRAAVAAEAKLPERKLRTARTVRKKAPQLAEMVRAGELSLKDAVKAIRQERGGSARSDNL